MSHVLSIRGAHHQAWGVLPSLPVYSWEIGTGRHSHCYRRGHIFAGPMTGPPEHLTALMNWRERPSWSLPCEVTRGERRHKGEERCRSQGRRATTTLLGYSTVPGGCRRCQSVSEAVGYGDGGEPCGVSDGGACRALPLSAFNGCRLDTCAGLGRYSTPVLGCGPRIRGALWREVGRAHGRGATTSSQ